MRREHADEKCEHGFQQPVPKRAGVSYIAEFKEVTLSGERVSLDGNSFKNCLFRNCEIVYAARGRVGLDSCTFENCSYTLDGPAQDTLLYLTALYKIDPRALETTFENIRSGGQPVRMPPGT
ncbi:MAG: hypothetical protein WA814_11920 [Candidatus Baltobacteraceae bacterium]